MLRARDNFEVLNSIVKSIVIFVMHKFCFKKRPFQMAFHFPAMFKSPNIRLLNFNQSIRRITAFFETGRTNRTTSSSLFPTKVFSSIFYRFCTWMNFYICLAQSIFNYRYIAIKLFCNLPAGISTTIKRYYFIWINFYHKSIIDKTWCFVKKKSDQAEKTLMTVF